MSNKTGQTIIYHGELANLVFGQVECGVPTGALAEPHYRLVWSNKTGDHEEGSRVAPHDVTDTFSVNGWPVCGG